MNVRYPFTSLDQIAENFGDRKSSLQYVFRDRGNIQIFESGSVVGTGFSSVEEAKTKTRQIAKLVSDVMKDIPSFSGEVGWLDFRINNMQATGRFGFSLLFRPLLSRPEVYYEPEEFPGIRWRYVHPEDPSVNISFSIFQNGHFTVVGPRSTYMALSAAEEVQRTLVPFKEPPKPAAVVYCNKRAPLI